MTVVRVRPPPLVTRVKARAVNTAIRPLRRARKRAQRAKYARQGKSFVHFLHIGKTGGTAIKTALRPHVVQEEFVVELHRHEKKLTDVPIGDKFFFFLRDPATRFVSGFYSRMREGSPRLYTRWSQREAQAFSQFSTPNELAYALSCANPGRRAQAEHAMRSIGHVRSSYQDWFGSEEYLRTREADLLMIGRQECLSDHFEILRETLGLPEQVVLPTDEIGTHRNPRGLDVRLEDRSISNLRRWYANDYRLLRLCGELAEQRGVPWPGEPDVTPV